MTSWDRPMTPKMKEIITRLIEDLDEDETTLASVISSKMCKSAQELYLCETLDLEISDIPELAKYKNYDNKEIKRVAFILSIIKLALKDIGAPIDEYDRQQTNNNQKVIK